MTIDATTVGRSYSAAADPYQVGREKIREFAEAIGDPNPAYRGMAAIAPPTFAFVVSSRALDLLLADPDLDLRLDRIVHGAQKFSYVRPIKAGDELTATATITAVRSAGDVEVIMYETVLATVEGEPVATSTATVSHNRAGETP
ncbi:MAG TPA: MaoC family dehydratase N-terminal domain-containing protein [Kribbella sp.]|nr:MaoC family dehydratase N-terminal domain-containing protein [Kribbella sp.]